MSLNIKNETVHELVREAARRTGKSQTGVVEAALRQYLDELEREHDYRVGDELLQRMQEALSEADGPRMEIEDLYDPVTGLPA